MRLSHCGSTSPICDTPNKIEGTPAQIYRKPDLFPMGFDIFVELSFSICAETGKPFYYEYDEIKKKLNRNYELPSILVPQELRQYIVGRGHLFRAYTQYFEDIEMGFNVSAEAFLEHYPSWDEVMEHEEFRDDIPEFWNENDHIGFRTLLEWCSKQKCSFQVTWSY